MGNKILCLCKYFFLCIFISVQFYKLSIGEIHKQT